MNNYYKMSPLEIDEDKKKRDLIVDKLSDSLLSTPNYDFKPTAETRAHDAYVAKLPMPQKQEKQLPAFNFNEYESRNTYQPTYNYKLPMPYKSNDTSDTSYNIAKSAIDNKDKDFWQGVRDKETEIGDKFKNSSLGKAWDSVANSGVGKFISRIGDTGANMVTGGSAKLTPTDTGSKVGNFLADLVGGGSGMFLNPGQNISYNQALRPIGSLAEKGTSKLTQNAPNVVKNLLPTMAREGVEQGIQEGMNANLNGADTKETLQAGLKGLGQGALFSGALKGANDYLLPNIVKTKTYEGSYASNEPTSVGKESPNIITPKKKLPVIEPLNEVKNEQLLNTLDNKKISSNFTKDDFTKIKNTQLEKYKPNVITENWNATKGQGRRNGGMVKGSMGISYGTSEKIDYDSVLNKIDIPKEDIKYLNTNTKKEMYLKSLENGYSHKQALLISSGYELATSDLKTLDPILKRINSEINVSPLQEIATTSEPQNIKNVLKSKNVKESQFKDGGTLRKSPIVADEASQKLINEINMEYEVKPNVQSVKRATNDLQTNFDGVVERIRNAKTLNSAEDTVASGLITRQLRQQAEETGDYTQLKSWLEEIQPKVTSTAQSLQALRTWQDMSPDGVLLKAQQVVGKVNRDGADVFGKNFKKVELTTDEMKYITDTMNKIQSMTDGRAKDVEFAKVKKVIADKIPSTLAEKVVGLQRISLLLNPKTMIRNVVGNVVMGGLEGVKDLPATALDKVLSKKTGQRTTLLPDLKTLGKGFVKGAKKTVEDARLGIDTSPSAGQFELPDKEIFNNKALKKLDKYTKVGLQLGDRPFYQAYYDDSLRQQMQLSKSDKPTEKMIENAKKVAEDRTFQNDSAMVQGFKRLQKGLNDIGAKFGVGSSKFGIGNFAIPFTKTPANILDKAVDYTPLGTISSIKQAFKIGSEGFDQKKFVDTVGRNIVGTAAIALGYDLAKDGLLTGGANKDKDVSSLERQAGKLPYAFKVGDKYITFDFAQPAAIPLAIGADIYHQGKNRKEAENVAIEALKSGGTTLFKQSLLQGMQRLFGGYSPVEGIANVISDIPTQFVPTSFKQINQLSDPNVKDTYAPSKGGQKLNEMKNRLPMLSKTLPNKVDTLGNDVKSFDGKNNIFNVMLNPSYTSTYNPSKAEKLALDLYENTGNTTHFPRVAKDKITYKADKETSKTINLTSQEKNNLQRYIGKETEKAFSEYAGNPTWNNKDDKEKIKDLQRRLTEIYNQGEYMILKGRGINEYKR